MRCGHSGSARLIALLPRWEARDDTVTPGSLAGTRAGAFQIALLDIEVFRHVGFLSKGTCFKVAPG
jgi:hypothetical protein